MGLLAGFFGGNRAARREDRPAGVQDFIRTVPVIINCRDRVSCLRRLVAWLEDAGHENIVLLDNASTYPPLLEYLGRCGHRVERLDRNLGHTALWQAAALERSIREQWFVYSDPDVVPDESCAPDLVARLREILERNQGSVKAGPALRTDDLPDHYHLKAHVIEHERQFYGNPLGPDLYQSFIDTTFAVYRPGTPYSHGPALRSTRYRARHLAWYLDSNALDDEEIYYRTHADSRISHWNTDPGQVEH